MKRLAALLVLSALFLRLTKPSFATTWSPSVKVNQDESIAAQRDPKVSFYDGNPICIWKKERPGLHNIYSSIEDGTWQEELLVSDSTTDSREQPDISGNIGVWNDYRSGSWLYSSIFNGTKWSTNVQVNSPPFTGGYEPFLAKSASGKVAVTWAGTGGYSWDIFYSEWTGNGWTPTETVTATDQTEWHPTLAFFGDRPIAAWLQPTAPGTILLYSTKEGGSWAPPRYIPTGDIMISSPGRPYLVANQSNTKLVVLWFDYRYSTNNIYLAEYDEASNSFVNDRAITDGGNKASGKPAGAFDSDGNLWVVWSESKSGKEQIYYTRRDSAGNWSENLPVSPSEFAQQNPDIDSQGEQVVVVWEQDSLATGRDIYASELSSSPPPKEPILIVPGMTASTSFGLFVNVNAKWRLWPKVGTDVYKGVIKTIRTAGYQEGSLLTVVPYDWRKPNNEIASNFLKPAIDSLKTNSPTGKVDIIAHSQGGIVSRAYIQSNLYENDVDTLVTVGSPHLGTSKTYYLWEGAETPLNYTGISKGIFEFLLSVYSIQEGGSLSKLEIVKKYFPSSKEILPVYDFLRDENGNLIDYTTLSTVNNFLLDLNNRGSELSSIHFKNLAGTGFDTTQILNVRLHSAMDGELWTDGFPIAEGYTDGDGTVTNQSAVSEFAEEVKTLNLGHSGLIADVNGIKEICKMLGVEAEEFFPGHVTSQTLHFGLRSPATLLVTSPSGKSIGFDPNTQTYINETENAELAGQDEEYKWLTIGDPEEGHYQVKILGTGGGNYHFTTIVENRDEFLIKEIQGTTQENQQDLIELLVDPDDPDEIEIIDPNGQIQEKSAISKIEELTKLSENDGFDFLTKRLKKILKFTEQGKTYQAIETLYEARREITFRVSSQSKRIFYKGYLDSIAEDLTEIYAATNKAKKQIAKAQILVAEKALAKAREIIEKRPSYEALEILKLGEEKLAAAKESSEKEKYAKAEILSIQARLLGAESILCSLK